MRIRWTAAVPLALVAACRGDERPALRVLTWAGEHEAVLEERVLDVFRAEHPELRVILETAPTSYEDRLLTSIASGTPPDVYLLDTPDIPTFLDRGLALDLTRYLAAVGYEPDSVFPQIVDAFRRGNRLYALPKDFTPMVIYFNRDVFERTGVPEPPADDWTWEEFRARARAVTRDQDGDWRPETYGFDFPRNLYQWVPFVWSAGGDILDPTGTRATGFLDGPPALSTYRFLTELVEVDRVTPGVQYLETGDPAREARFATGGQAMLLSGHWTYRVFADAVASGALDLGIAPLPHRADQPPATVLYASAWAVPPNVARKRQAILLAAHLASERAQRIRSEARLAVSARVDVARARAESDPSGVEALFLREAQRGRMTWGARVRDFRDVEEAALAIMDAHLLEGVDLEQSAARAARVVDGLLRR